MSDAQSTETDPRISDEEFMRRLRKRFLDVAGVDDIADSISVAEWRDGFDNDPEDAADEEMSYWADDGDE